MNKKPPLEGRGLRARLQESYPYLDCKPVVNRGSRLLPRSSVGLRTKMPGRSTPTSCPHAATGIPACWNNTSANLVLAASGTVEQKTGAFRPRRCVTCVTMNCYLHMNISQGYFWFCPVSYMHAVMQIFLQTLNRLFRLSSNLL